MIRNTPHISYCTSQPGLKSKHLQISFTKTREMPVVHPSKPSLGIIIMNDRKVVRYTLYKMVIHIANNAGPQSVTIVASDDLWIVDSNFNKIRRIVDSNFNKIR